MSHLLLTGLLLSAVSSFAPAQQPPSSPGRPGSAQVKELLATIADGLGDPEKLRSLNSLRVRSNYSAAGFRFQYDTVVAWPDRVHMDMMGAVRMITVISETVAFIDTKSWLTGKMDASAWKESSLNWYVRSQVPFVVQHANDPGASFALAGTETVNGVVTQVLEVNFDGKLIVKWYVDPDTGRVLRAVTQSGTQSVTRDYSDWRSVDGLVLPFRWRYLSGAPSDATEEVTEVQINPTLDPVWFSKPTNWLGPITAGRVTPAPNRLGIIEVWSQPGQAQVYLDDQLKGLTDAQGSLSLRSRAGTRRLNVALAGYMDSAQEVTVTAGDTTKVEVRLMPPTASLKLQTKPGTVQVYLDDEFKGMSSSEGHLVLSNLRPGNHHLRLMLGGYKEWSQPLDLAAGDSKALEVNLEPAGPKPLTLSDVEQALNGGLSRTRIATLVKQYGVDFSLTAELQQRLRSEGADDALLLAISTNKK